MERIWAPWRHHYFDQPKMQACFICRAIAEGETHDRENLLLLRGPDGVIMLNRYPYTVGALMVAPAVHRATVRDVPDDTLLELMRLVKQSMDLLDRAIHPQGYNIGINQGVEAGAGLHEHLHIHVVPRWGADTNFMTAIGGTRVMSESLEHMYDRLRAVMEQ